LAHRFPQCSKRGSEAVMRKEARGTKVRFVFVCPKCGSEGFKAREKPSMSDRLLGQSFKCGKCNATFRQPLRERASRFWFAKNTTGHRGHRSRRRR